MLTQETNATPSDQTDDNIPFLDDRQDPPENVIEQEPAASAASEDKPSADRAPHSFAVKHAFSKPGDLGTGESVFLPGNFDSEIRAAIDAAPNINMVSTDDQRQWANALNEGLSLNTYSECLVPTLADPDSHWEQSLEENGRELMGGSPKLRPLKGEIVQGDSAAIRMMSFLGLGTVYQAPMWHSGFWVTFRPCTEGEWLELNRVMMTDNINYGRSTYGLSHSNSTVYSVERIAQFALNHVYDITVKADELNISNLFEHLAPQDLPHFIHGFMCSIYAQGFHYRRACTNAPEKCNYVLEEILNLQKLQWVNTRALTPWQRVHMSDRQSKCRTLEQVKRYREEMTRLQPSLKPVRLDDKEFKVLLGVPSANDYFTQGHRWISGIAELVDGVLGPEATTKDRNDMILAHAKASSLRQFQHWVKEIQTDTFVINKPEDIERQLALLSSNDRVRTFMMTTIGNYINHSTVAVIGIPTFTCPVCSGAQEPTEPKVHAKNILPLDVVQLFFVLHMQRIAKILKR